MYKNKYFPQKQYPSGQEEVTDLPRAELNDKIATLGIISDSFNSFAATSYQDSQI